MLNLKYNSFVHTSSFQLPPKHLRLCLSPETWIPLPFFLLVVSLSSPGATHTQHSILALQSFAPFPKHHPLLPLWPGF